MPRKKTTEKVIQTEAVEPKDETTVAQATPATPSPLTTPERRHPRPSRNNNVPTPEQAHLLGVIANGPLKNNRRRNRGGKNSSKNQ